MGAVHLKQLDTAKAELNMLESIHQSFITAKDDYKANLLRIQISTANAWIKYAEGNGPEAIALMTEAAEMEDGTEKHPVTPGELLPARELLGDLYIALKQPQNAFDAYQLDLKRHPNR